MEAYEVAASRQINDSENPSAQTAWMVSGATDYIDARATLDVDLPTEFTFPSSRVAYLDSIEASELRDDELWRFDIGYRSQPKPTFGELEYEFDISAPTENIYQSLQTTAYAPAGKSAPDFGGAIGLADGTPRGLPPLTPMATFAITKHWRISDIDVAYQVTVENLVGAVASGGFFSRSANTVRFLGARGRTSGDKFPISYSFGVRPTVSNRTIDGITVTTAGGWDLIDTYYEALAEIATSKIVRRPRAVYVHRVHPTDSLDGLGL